MAKQRSPLTGHDVETREEVRRDIFHFDDICGRWSITQEADFGEASILGGRLETETGRLSETETRHVFALARSEVWRVNHKQQKVPLFMTLRGAKAARQRDPSDDRNTVILTVEELSEVAPTLTLEEKALKTLENLAIAENEIGAGTSIPYLLREYPGRPDWQGKAPNEVGVSYACTEIEAPMIYQFLIENKTIVVHPPQSQQSSSRAFVTPKGYARISALTRGVAATVSQAFLVCRFIPELDDLFERVFRPIGVDLGCTVQRIKDIHHIDKIDDRICEEIRRSRIVLVDLTEQNFNVAFEAGYALALHKPIVWTKRKGASGEGVMPFDIYTYNCLEWETDKIDEFRGNLKYRVLAALQKAERQSL
jgi:hypothetical protein